MATFLIRRRAGTFLKQIIRATPDMVVHPQARILLHLNNQHYRSISYSDLVPKRFRAKATEDAAVESADVDEDVPVKDREKFIPITSQSLVRYLMQEEKFLTKEEQNQFENFCLALESAISTKTHELLQDLKALFDPLNPDKDTVSSKQWKRKDLIDTEFWLLQKLSHVMHKANFHELSKTTIEEALAEHSSEGVVVSVDPNKYDVLRFWALGKAAPPVEQTRAQRFWYWMRKKPAPKPEEYYKRVVVAVRLRRDDKLMLKIFKEVPVMSLEQLLPDGKIMMSRLDKGVLTTSAGIALTGVLAWVVTVLAHIYVPTTLIVAAVPTAIGIQSWTSYKNRRNQYLADLNRMLYYKNIANNRGLLALLVDRAEDEIFKEALLAYTFLLTNRPPSALEKGSSEHLPAELGGIPAVKLETNIEDFVYRRTRARIEYESEEPLKLLQDLGIVSEADEQYNVLPLVAAMKLLPQKTHSIVDKIEEYDIIEGYDVDITDENEQDYKEEADKRRKFGWF